MPFPNIRCVITLLAVIFALASARAQQNSLSDSIQTLVKQAEMDAATSGRHLLAFQKLALAETLAKKTNSPTDLLRVYSEKAYLCFANQDSVNSQKYILKAKKLLPYCNDSLETAVTYNKFGIIESRGLKKIYYFLKAHHLFTKYSSPENLIDVNFNLAGAYKMRKNWEHAIKYSRMGLEAINKFERKKDRAKFFQVYLLECYTALGDYKNAKKALHALDSVRNNLNIEKYKLFEFNYLIATSNLYSKMGLYKEALDLKTKALMVSDKLQAIAKHRLSDGMVVEHELNLKKEELKRSEMEVMLNETRIKAQLIFIILICSLLVFLTILAFYQKRNTQKIRAINSVLEKQNADLENITKELEKALEAKTEFLNVMTHELFTPINGIAIIIQNLKSGVKKETFNQSLELLEFSSNYLYRLLKNVVDTKSIDNQEGMVLNLDVTHLKSFVKTVVQTTSIFLKTSTNNFRHFIDSRIPDPLYMDSVKISQILINLLNNANKFTSNGTISLTVELEQESGERAKIRFKIKDTGIGIDAESLPFIFEKFQHGSDTIKQKYGGSGVGLYVVKHFLSLHDSQLTVSTEKHKGTSFSFSIWFNKVKKAIAEHKNSNEPTTGKILLVDDNKVNLIVTKKLLESNAFECDTAENGFEALELTKRNAYNVILMDIMMPGMNGFETTRNIKNLQIETPVIALTAVDVGQNKVEFEKTGFAAIITKPFNSDELFKIIKAFVKLSE